MIPVPAEQLERIELEAIDGRRLGAGRLGQNRGMRAVRLTLTPQSRGSGTAMDMPGASMDAAPLVAPEAGGGLPSLGLGEADPLPEPGLLLPLPGDDGGALPMAMPMGDGLGDDMGGLQIDGLGEGLDLPLPEPMGIALPDPLDPLDDPLVDLPPMAKAAGAS